MERKYRQKGYQEESKDSPKERPKSRQDNFGPRQSAKIETRFTDVIRCSNCSTIFEVIDGNVAFADQCKKCKSDLHSCKNCRYFDPGARFECQKPVDARIAKKTEKNMCMQFAVKVSVEKQLPAPETKRENISSGRKAFDDLFKK